jgi:type VI protein secretion system component Hcp
MFMKIDTVDGEAQDSKHKKEIDVLSWSWGISNSGSAHNGREPWHQDLMSWRSLDASLLSGQLKRTKRHEY